MIDLEEDDGLESTAAPEHEVRSAVVRGDWHGWRLDKVLVAMAPEFSRSHLQGLIDQGLVVLDGAAAALASRKVKAGQSVQVELRPTA
jgi:23S rRNA pseudouridine1911/1915/1917 synthase